MLSHITAWIQGRPLLPASRNSGRFLTIPLLMTKTCSVLWINCTLWTHLAYSLITPHLRSSPIGSVHSFMTKLGCEKLDNVSTPPLTITLPESCKSSFTDFKQVSEDTVCKVINESASKCCQLDPIPTWLVKKCLDELLPHITKIINLLLSSETVPAAFKLSHIVPLLKKQNLDPNELKNYRPVANLPFLFKVLERIVTTQIKEYMQEHNLFSVNQSAYRKFHSTETALLCVTNDLLLVLDKGHEAVLVLLDYSCAFDTINHSMLFERFKRTYGICGTVLKWCVSYLDSRKQAIVIGDSISDAFPLPWGVPQGSVKGPFDFIMYSAPLSNVINAHHDIHHVIYADDTQLYLTMESIH